MKIGVTMLQCWELWVEMHENTLRNIKYFDETIEIWEKHGYKKYGYKEKYVTIRDVLNNLEKSNRLLYIYDDLLKLKQKYENTNRENS